MLFRSWLTRLRCVGVPCVEIWLSLSCMLDCFLLGLCLSRGKLSTPDSKLFSVNLFSGERSYPFVGDWSYLLLRIEFGVIDRIVLCVDSGEHVDPVFGISVRRGFLGVTGGGSMTATPSASSAATSRMTWGRSVFDTALLLSTKSTSSSGMGDGAGCANLSKDESCSNGGGL